VGILFLGINYSTQVEVGLDRSIVLPKGSYLRAFDSAFDKYVVTGPPLFIVIRNGFDYTNETQQNSICTLSGCNNNSVVNQYDSAPYMLGPTNSWLDGYLEYGNSVTIETLKHHIS
jgi:Niemann-Pick C1 protein